MHELKLTEGIVAILNKEVASPEVGKVKNIYLEVGKLRYIVPDIISNCFRHMPKDKKLEAAEIVIEELPVKVKCQDCGEVSVVEESNYSCNRCLSSKTQIISGDELNIKGIEW